MASFCLTDRRLLAREPDAAEWQAWPLQTGMSLHHGDQGGVGHLWLHDETRRLAGWRFTLGMNPDALALATRFERQMHRVTAGETDPEDEAEAEETDFGVEAQERPSTWVLLRLWRFAHPLPLAVAGGLFADSRVDRCLAGAAIPDDSAHGRCADPVPERTKDRPQPGGLAAGRPAGRVRCGLGLGLGPAPGCWLW